VISIIGLQPILSMKGNQSTLHIKQLINYKVVNIILIRKINIMESKAITCHPGTGFSVEMDSGVNTWYRAPPDPPPYWGRLCCWHMALHASRPTSLLRRALVSTHGSTFLWTYLLSVFSIPVRTGWSRSCIPVLRWSCELQSTQWSILV
jgi:hypothetical protein